MPRETKTPDESKHSSSTEAKSGGEGKTEARREKAARRPAAGAEPRVSLGGSVRTVAGGAPFDLDNLFSWLGGVVGQLGEVVEKAKEGEYAKHGEFKVTGLGEKARGVYGVSVKVGAGGQPAFEHFGNIHPTPKGPEMSEVREPLVDVFDEESELLVVAELPGASEQDIAIEVEGDELRIRAEGEHRYGKVVPLPAKVKPEPVRKVYRNGLFEARFEKI